ncbi:MAG TPA: GTPase HflX [Kiritimatiellia bacterium]|nr:GTPase HflX [Kiritimatiellia bacterium]HPR68231.1 GTPase HflX [Kiritimatiellia bacterium]
MTLMHPTRSDAPDHAWLIATHLGDTPRAEVEDSLRELRALADTAQAGILGETVCRLRDIHPATYIGRGKATQIAEEAAAAGATLVIFDDDLSPAQGRALEDLFRIRVVDRTQLILDIFAQRALSLEGRLQIELAQLRYLIPRLRGLWTHLERQKGGIGLKGPGEKQLELDRRRIEQRITRIKAQLQIVRQRRAELRRGRRRHGWALLTLVGYTNAGKSTLLNTLTEAGVHADDQLFATLDPTTRQLRLPNHQPCLLTDTVGFIRKLPHHLVEAFKATLEEVNEADLLLHVIDASQPRVDEQIAAVEAVLRELGAEAKPVLAVFNKTDLEKGRNQAIRLADRFRNSVAISAATGDGTGTLCQAIADLLRDRVAHLHLKIPAGEGRWMAALHANGKVLEQKVRGKQLHVEAVVSASFAATLPPDWIVS